MKESLSYTLLSDADLSVSKQFGLTFKAPAAYDKILPNSSGGKNTGNLLPVPSVFILDKKGTIQFEYINPNFKQRVNPDLLKAAAQTHYIRIFNRKIMKRNLIILLSVLFMTKSFSQKTRMNTDSSRHEIVFTENNWSGILSKAKTTDKYIFVDAFTSWCGPCKLLKSTTFKDKDVAVFFNKHFINASFDMEKGEGVALADKWQIDAYPSLLILNSDGKVILEKIGYVEPKELLAFAQEALSKK